ncbi:MAG: hypothetical protein MR292_06465 [Alistipes sp.]|nr:hypothetical protein [Alistipes sp.]
MKHLTLALLALAATFTAAAQRVIENPDIDYVPTWITFTEISLGSDRTVVKAELRNRPNWWVKVSSSTHLIDSATGNKYRILGTEGIELDKEIYMPESGKIPCTLFFEAVPASAKRLNMVEEGNQPDKNVYGVHLVKQAPKAPAVGDDGIDPRTMTAEYYMSLPPSSAEVNIDYRRHRGMEFCKSSKAHIKVHLDNYSPEIGVSVVKLTGYDHVSHGETSVLAEIGPDHTYEADIPMDYPQYVFADFPTASWLLIPGDTLEVFATVNSDGAAFRSTGESAMINALNNKLLDRFYTRGYDRYWQMKDSVAAGRAATEALIDHLTDKYNRVWDGTFAEQYLRDTPLSSFGKELVMVNAGSELLEFMEDVYSMYNDKSIVQRTAEDGSTYYESDPDFEKLDPSRMFDAIRDYQQFIYDNPLTLMSSTTWVIFNRSEYNPVFRSHSRAAYEYTVNKRYGEEPVAATLLESIEHINSENMLKYGIGECFMAEMARARGQLSMLSDMSNDMDYFDKEEFVDACFDATMNLLTTITNPYITRKIVEEYIRAKNKIAEYRAEKAGEKVAGTTTKAPASAEEKVLQRIIEPYAGNLLYLDFWGMGCGPCRAGMLAQRDIVEELSNEPVRFLYICEEAASPRKEAEKWMTEKSIKGEHIYISSDDWNRLTHLFEFSGIPHAVLIGRDGKVITNGFYLSSADDLRKHLK